jgi:hypothetical protein
MGDARRAQQRQPVFGGEREVRDPHRGWWYVIVFTEISDAGGMRCFPACFAVPARTRSLARILHGPFNAPLAQGPCLARRSPRPA